MRRKISERHIVFECGNYWILDTGKSYEVLANTVTHAVVDSAYERNKDGLSIAVYRCKYLANEFNDRKTKFLRGKL